ncbi:MAG: FtsX-like permease family protein, partial [Alphaproteobacteria bacterium]|nr:FtsX-like permease family protein [Alphaproteobacteria bacterium]
MALSTKRIGTAMGNTLTIAWRELRHGWRHFVTFLACLVLGITVITSIGTLGAAINDAMEAEADSLLGGNAEVTLTAGEATGDQLAALQYFGKTSHVITTRAMLRHGENPLLVEVKAVDEAYPLIGEMTLADGADRAASFTPDSIVVDKSLLEQLDAEIGDKVSIGSADYTIAAVLTREPDRVVQIFTFGPRVMLSPTALERSGILSGYSLARHHYRIAFNDAASVEALEAKVKETFREGSWRIKTTTDGNESVDRFLGQLTLFLTLSGLATFLIGGIGIGSSVRAFMEKKIATIAVMKTIGASRRQILQVYVLVIGALTVIGSLVGIVLSAAIVTAFLPIISQWLPIAEGTVFDAGSALLAGWYGLLITFLFSLPALVSALGIRPSLLFRSSAGITPLPSDRRIWPIIAVLLVLLLVTLFVNFTDTRFIVGFVGVAIASFLVFGGCTRLVQLIASRMKVRQPWLRLALGNLHRPGATTGTVVLAIGVSLTVLVAVALTEANFQHRITEVVEADAPSLFMMDIQPEQRDPLRSLLVEAAGEDKVMMFPMVRGRITALNGQPVSEESVDEDVRWAVRGDRGLSYGANPPQNANIVQGEWWPADYRGAPQASIDERFLAGMNLKLGDTMTLDILGEEVTATITSARRMNYTTFQMNFAIMLSPGVIDDFPQTQLATVYLPDSAANRQAVLREVARQFPNVTTIRTTEAVTRVKEVLDKVATALSITVVVSLV